MRGASLQSIPVMSLVVSISYIIAFYLSEWSAIAKGLRLLFGAIILFYLLGASIRGFMQQVLHLPNKLNPLSVGALGLDVLLSILITIAISTALVRTFLFYETLFAAVVVGLLVVLSAARLTQLPSEGSQRKDRSGVFERLAPRTIVPFLTLILFSILFASFFRSKTPFPSLSGWDMFAALAPVNWIISHHGYEYIFIPAYPSGLLPYPALLFFIIAAYSLFLGVDPFSIYWYGIYFSIFFYMTLVYLIALGMSRNPYLSLSSAFIAFLAGAGFGEVVRTPLHLTLDVVGQLFFLLLMVFHMFYTGAGKHIVSLVAVFFLALLNFFTTVAVFPFLLFILLNRKSFPVLGDGRRAFRFATVLMGLVLPIVMYATSSISPVFSAYLSPPEGEFPLSLKLQTLQAIYLPYFLAVFSLTLGVLIFRHIQGVKFPPGYADLILYISACFIIYFQPAYITYRIEFYSRVFMAIFISGLFPLKGD